MVAVLIKLCLFWSHTKVLRSANFSPIYKYRFQDTKIFKYSFVYKFHICHGLSLGRFLLQARRCIVLSMLTQISSNVSFLILFDQATGPGRFPPARRCIAHSRAPWTMARSSLWATWDSMITGSKSWDSVITYFQIPWSPSWLQAVCEEDYKWPADHVWLRQGDLTFWLTFDNYDCSRF